MSCCAGKARMYREGAGQAKVHNELSRLPRNGHDCRIKWYDHVHASAAD
jgi:hypothetical protein